MAWLQLKHFDGFFWLVVNNLGAAQADTTATIVKSGFVSIKRCFETLQDLSIVRAFHDLKALEPKESTIAPITPLEGESDEAYQILSAFTNQAEPEVWVLEDLFDCCLVVCPLILHSLAVALK